MKRLRLPTARRLIVAASVALVAVAPPLRALADPYQVLSPDQVEKMLGAPDVRIFDANSQEVFAKNHVPGAVHIGSQDLPALLPADKAVRLVFYCTNPG